jgi:hypothetical protein
MTDADRCALLLQDKKRVHPVGFSGRVVRCPLCGHKFTGTQGYYPSSKTTDLRVAAEFAYTQRVAFRDDRLVWCTP